uniref:Uncharacterized protein n=1 Tax=Parascaris equorum TaxID=6256 RepID=A0A914R581_PAREQ
MQQLGLKTELRQSTSIVISKAIGSLDLAAGRKAIEQDNSDHETPVDETERSPLEMDSRVEGTDGKNLQSNSNLDRNNCGAGNDLA